MERTLTALRKALKGDVYVFLRNAQIGRRFLRDAEAEGYTIAGGRPTEHPYARIMALHNNTICYVGANGAIRFGCGGTRDFHRVDYEKYLTARTVRQASFADGN